MNDTALAAVLIAALAFVFGLRYLAYRAADLVEQKRIAQLEQQHAALLDAFAQHKDTHSKAIANLVAEMRKEIAETKTRAGLALERSSAKPRRFG